METSTTTMNDYVRIRMPKVDILKIRKLLETNYKVEHDLAEGIAEAIDIALKDQDLSNEFTTKEDVKEVDRRIDKIIDRIDNLEHTISTKFEIVDQKFDSVKHMIESSRKTTVIWVGGIMGAGIVSLMYIFIKYMPTIAKIVEMAAKSQS